MNDGSIKITIGAAMDRSVETVFGAIEKRAQRASQNISKSFSNGFAGGTGSGGATKGFDAAASAARKAERDIERELAKQVKATKSAYREMEREHAKSKREAVKLEQEASRDIIRQFKEITRARKKELDEQERDAKRAADAANKASSRFGQKVGMYASRNLFPYQASPMHFASRVGRDLLSGAGIDMSMSGSVARAVQMQSGSVQLANQERIATGSTIGGGAWNKVSRDIGGKYSADSGNIQEMLLAFTAKTGQFGAAKGIGDDLAKMSLASGANMKDMGNAAGYVYNQLQKLPDAGKRTIEVMRGIVGQTAVGAVDMPDYAVQLGRIAANASKFEGSVSTNIRKQSALAQLAVESGGASSPADAARSVASFSNTFGKHARIAAFEKEGVNLFTDDKKDTLRDPFEIVKDSFRKTGGNIEKISSMFADTLGRKPVQAVANAYKAAGGGEKGIAAIQASFDKYMKAQLSKEAEDQNLKDYQESTAAKAQKFQNSLDSIVNTMADRTMPALEKLAPTALKAADALGGIVSWASENPLSGLAAALGASIAQSAVQSSVRMGIEKLFTSTAGGGIALSGAVMLYAAGVTLINEDIKSREDEQRRRAVADGDAGNEAGKIAQRARNGTATEGDAATLEAINKNLRERVSRAKVFSKDNTNYSDTTGGGEFGGNMPLDSGGTDVGVFDSRETVASKQDAKVLTVMSKQLENNERVLQMIRTGVQKVEITNLPPATGNGPLVDPAGRSTPTNWVQKR